MPTTILERGRSYAAVAAGHAAGSAPTAASEGFHTARFERIRTFVTYAGAVTACRLRLWLRDPDSGEWFKAASTDDDAPLAPGGGAGRESRDWEVGPYAEVYFQVESISPGTAGNTVAVRVAGVEALR
jgi:hypothetical protein